MSRVPLVFVLHYSHSRMSRYLVVALCAVCVLAESRQSPQELLKEAVAFQQAGHYEEAVRDYNVFLAMFPSAASVRSNLGAALVSAGQYSDAIAQYQLSLDQQPDPRVRFNLALAYYKSGKFKEAAEELNKVWGGDPSNTNAAIVLADCYLHLGRNREAIDVLTPLHKTRPGDLGVAYLLGTALLRDGRIGEGQLAINEIMARGDSAEVHILLGTSAFGARDFQKAVAELRKATEMNPRITEGWVYYGLCLLATGEVSRSRDAFLEALKLDPNDFQSNLNVGLSLRLDKKPAEAKVYFERASAVRPDDLATQYQLALTSMELGDRAAAAKMLEQITSVAPSFTEPHVSLASLYYREHRKQDGDRERAIVERLTAEAQAKEPAQQSKK